MKRAIISLGVASMAAVLVYLALPPKMYVETAGNIIVLSFIGAAVATWVALWLRQDRR